MNRRSFLKTLAAAAGVSFVPEICFAVPHSVEPDKWHVELENYDTSFGVGATWFKGEQRVRHAVRIDSFRECGLTQKEAEDLCKQALRQWYVERGQFKWKTLNG